MVKGRLLAALILLQAVLVYGQTRYAGLQHPFILGAGARALGLGSAMVAYPADATTVYWNPAGLDLLQRKNLSAFHMNIPKADVSYNFVGYAHPFLGLGTLGVGILHLGTEFEERDDIGLLQGTSPWSDFQIMLAYARELPFSLSLGGSIKIHRQSVSTSQLDDPAQGFGADFGLIYRPDFDEGFLQDLSLGLSVVNLIEPPLKLDTKTDPIPRILRAGLAKPIPISSGGDVINLFLSYQQGSGDRSRLQFGSEYVYQGRAMLRFGNNGSAFNFGGGIVYDAFQLDYATGRYSNDASDILGFEHRISLTVELGKSKEEMIEERIQRENERIEAQIRKQRQLEKQAEFAELMHDGKELYQQEDYTGAYFKFSAAKNLFVSDPDAQVWLDKAEKKKEEQDRQKQLEYERIAAERATRYADSVFVENQLQKGKQYFDAGQFQDAIAQWEVGLERDPNDARLQSWIAKTKEEVRRRLDEMLNNARSLENSNRLSEAVQVYSRLLTSGAIPPEERQRISDKIDALQTQLNVKELFNQGVTAYLDRDYDLAVKHLKKVVQLDPRNKVAKDYLWYAESHLGKREEKFATEEIRRRFIQAVRLDQSGKYKEALKILEEIQRQQRYSKRILDLMDQVREKIRQ